VQVTVRFEMFRTAPAMALAALSMLSPLAGAAQSDSAPKAAATPVMQYVQVPMPPGFKVEISELDGPVFADSSGKTLYSWPSRNLRNGYAGEQKGIVRCYDTVLTETAGLMSPYPAGVRLPDLDKRPSCTDLWPPVLAADGAEKVGKWTLVDRKDGKKQWAYDEQPLYTSVRDRQPGDVLGGDSRQHRGDRPVVRVPVSPPALVPPGFAVKTTVNGQLLTTDKNYSVYVLQDSQACDAQCMRRWEPIIAPDAARAQGEWTKVERSPGVKQWAFRDQLLYSQPSDSKLWSLEGSDEPGWQNVYVQTVKPRPSSFTVQDTLAGQVLADSRGMTIYTYVCGDDSLDQLSCEFPEDTQAYRLAVCGGGSVEKCLQNWPYVKAEPGAKSESRLWSIMSIDPATGHRAKQGQSGAIEVWAYRERPVYTYIGDAHPGDVNGAGTGEWRGQRNGLKAFWVRDDFFNGTL
jgi:predicted lipoprotein with Yx(FWY)xxD motif